MDEKTSWMDLLFKLLEREMVEGQSTFKRNIQNIVIGPVSEGLINLVLPYFVSVVVLLAVTVILLGITLYFIVNYVAVERPVFAFPEL